MPLRKVELVSAKTLRLRVGRSYVSGWLNIDERQLIVVTMCKQGKRN